ncbi:MAG TPA: alkaline phosphatase family protein [Thermoanaerobaculia bacterium]|nr:alkaline phosphatase family protein [Thermoanaerobaculia bacterium]
MRRPAVWRSAVLRLAVLAALLLAGVVAGIRSFERVQGYRRAEAVCAAMEEGDWARTLALAEGFSGSPVQQRRVGECRCVALLESGDRAACVATLEAQIAAGAAEAWLPSPPLAAVVVEARRDAGDVAGAAQLAHRAAVRYPDVFVLTYLELDLRTRLEDEGAVLAELRQRLPQAAEAAPLLAVHLADRLVQREEWEPALEVLGEEAPADPRAQTGWFRHRTLALAGSGRADALAEAFGQWAQAGEPAPALRARYAVLASIFPMPTRRPPVELLLASLAEADAIDDPALVATLYTRTVRVLAGSGRQEEALAVLRQRTARFGEMGALTEEELLRSVEQRELLAAPNAVTVQRAALRLRVPAARGGDVLLLSPAAAEPLDSPFQPVPVPADGELRVEREPDVAPLRWVLRDGDGAVRGSGAVWPAPGQEVAATVQRRPPRRPAAAELAWRPADGRRRVFLVILDSADWRLAQYLRARGELPVLDRLLEAGTRAVLDSDPPYTAAALDAIVRPGARGVSSLAAVAYQLGSEIEALSFVADNPVAALRWVLPEAEDLFSVLGGGPHTAVNLLRSFGTLRIGRHAHRVGPRGIERPLRGYRAARELSAEERGLFQLGSLPPNSLALLREMAADFDTATTLARGEGADLVALRVASLDILTHSHFAGVSAAGQDDGDATLFDVYRYADRRLGELVAALDGDDVLLVMSDHGARTAMEHDRSCLFVAAGGEVPPGRVAGRPALVGIGRLVAELLGVAVDWPATGIEAWAEGLPGAATSGRPPAPSGPSAAPGRRPSR